MDLNFKALEWQGGSAIKKDSTVVRNVIAAIRHHEKSNRKRWFTGGEAFKSMATRHYCFLCGEDKVRRN